MKKMGNPARPNMMIFHNKQVYFQMGLKKLVHRQTGKDLRKDILMKVDDKKIDLPPVEGIIILNILSWASGANPWGPGEDDHFSKPNHYDGKFEIVGVNGVIHMGGIKSRLSSGVRIAQGGHLHIQFLTEVPVQVDGEPWTQPQGYVTIARTPLCATMLKKPKKRMRRRNTEPTILSPEGAIGSTKEFQVPDLNLNDSKSPLTSAGTSGRPGPVMLSKSFDVATQRSSRPP